MSTDILGDQFCKLPDDILLKVFRNLCDFDLISVRKVCKRFETVSQDKTLVRHIDFSSCYGLSSTALIKYLRPVTDHVESLSLNNCYWLSAKCCDTIMRCRRLLRLHILHVSISTARLVTLLGHLKRLQYLSVNLTNLREFQKMLSGNSLAQGTMKGIRVLTLRLKQRKLQAANMTMQLMSVTSFFEYCSSLEEFHIQGPFYNCGIPNEVVRPQIKQLDNLKNLHTMTMTDTTDASVRMFFFGVLLEVARLAEVRFRSLLMPMVVTRYLAEQRDYVNCIQHIEGLRHFDISYSTTGIPSQVHQFERAQQLTYLNLSENVKIDCGSLKVLANSCPKLTSINLRNCHHLHHNSLGQDEYEVDISGLQELVMNCTALTSINVSGVHIHPSDLHQSPFTSICQLLALNHNWRSLSLSPCSLASGTIKDDIGIQNNRKRSADQANLPDGKRQRRGFQVSTMNMDEDIELYSELGVLVRSCPYVEHFELIGANFRSLLSKRCQRDVANSLPMYCQTERMLKENDLMCIRRWKHLRTLQLSLVAALQRGDCLGAVLRECCRLERLMISELGVTPIPAYQQALMCALPFAHRLRDLRIEQCRLHLRYPMWHALSQLTSLQRLCILGKKSSFCPADVHSFVQRVPSLVLIQLFISEIMTLKACNELQTKLVTTFKEQRPAMSVCIMPLLLALNKMEDMPIHLIPDVHLETMSILHSSVAHIPRHPSPTPTHSH